MPSAAYAVPTMIVGQEKDDVGPIGGLGQGVCWGSEQKGNKPCQPSKWSSHAGRTINLAKRKLFCRPRPVRAKVVKNKRKKSYNRV
jgi:hypothetical protein